jgi:hypothetical protein
MRWVLGLGQGLLGLVLLLKPRLLLKLLRQLVDPVLVLLGLKRQWLMRWRPLGLHRAVLPQSLKLLQLLLLLVRALLLWLLLVKCKV